MIYSVLKFGAVGDGITNDAIAIQKAIDACHEKGGGRVLLDSGHIYYSSSIHLKSHVDLHVEKGALLKAHKDINTYFRPNLSINTDENRKEGNPVTGKPSFVFIYGKDAHHLTLSGEGTIDGNAYAFVNRINDYFVDGEFYPRPTMIYTEHCNHATFKDITLCNAPFWTLHPAGSDDVLVDRIRILNDLDVANSDGIDPDHCTNVRISNCHIQCADDCICLKTTEGNKEFGPTKNVIITGCTLITTSSAIKIGTEGVANFENILVDNCIITNSNRGLSIQIRDGGHVRNVSFSNIMIETRCFSEEWWGNGEPIVITCHDRDQDTVCGTVQNIKYYNITCDSENGIFISGNDRDAVKNIRFEKIELKLRNKSKWPKGLYDLRPYPMEPKIIERSSPHAFIRYAKNVQILDSIFDMDKQDMAFFAKEEIICEHTSNIYVNGETLWK